MRDKLWKKGLVFGIIVLFVGAGVIPSIGGAIVERRCLKDNKTSFMSFNPRGNILYVGGDGPGNYTNIQDAIDNASDGDTVFVYHGTYYENILVNKSIDLVGEDRDTTVIDGGKNGVVVYIFTDMVCITGFTIQKSGRVFLGWRAGLKVTSDGAIIQGNVIRNNQVGIFLESASNTLIMDNTLIKNIRGIYLRESSNNNTLAKNSLTLGGSGISLYDSSYNTIINNTIQLILLNCIYLSDSYYNKIKYNNFFNLINALCSFESTVTFKFQLEEGMKKLKQMARTNVWFNNYWNRPRILPKPIRANLKVDALIGKAHLEETIYLWDLFPARQRH